MDPPGPTAYEPAWSTYLAWKWGGVAEYRTVDGSRVDVLTDDMAWEVEWCKKWKESVGQALFYGAVTNRAPGVVLLLRRKPSEKLYFLRAVIACREANVRLMTWETR
jgi:hypothetical protein